MISSYHLKSLMNTFKKLFFLIFVVMTSNVVADQPPIDTGPELGSKLPAMLVVDQFGDKQVLSNAMREKGAVIVLFRSADWCPFCKRHLLELNDVVGKFKKKGYGVVGISYDSPQILRKFSQSKKLRFSLWSDQDVKTFKAFNVVNTDHEPTDRHYGIPFPGVIVVNEKNEVIHKYFFEGYKKRVKFKKLFKELM